MSRRTAEWRRFVCTLSLAALLIGGMAVWVIACDTPVYRYAMYRWQPAPYEVYFFHREPAAGEDKKIEEMIKSLPRHKDAPANVVYLPVNLNDDAELVGVPPDVKQAWQAEKDRPLPSYMFVSPLGIELYTGKLDTSAAAAIVDSPARKQFAKLLEKGNAGVFVLIEGKEAAANDAAEQVIGELILDVEKGKVNLYQGPADAFADLPTVGPDAEKENEAKEAEKKEEKPQYEVGMVRVSRDDPKEQWLVRMLMGVERDLGDFADQPMVFAVYGRGRALPPYIGKGVSRDNLLECLYFVTGACSCTVKEQNPGLDLLVRHDWESAAAKMAEKYGGEEGAENKFAAEDLFPDLIFTPQDAKAGDDEDAKTGDDQDTKPAADDGAAQQDPPEGDQVAVAQTDDAAAPPQVDNATPPLDPAAAKNDEPSAADEKSGAAPPAKPNDDATPAKRMGGESKQVALLSQPTGDVAADAQPQNNAADAVNIEEGSYTPGTMATVGIGVGIALFVLLGATLFIYTSK